jgi:Family of unknown function (DUF5996)
MTSTLASSSQVWPALPLDAWTDTKATLHLWTQIVGKIRLALSAWQNHGWHSTLYVTPRGLSTLAVPHGVRTFQIDFDFIDHRLLVRASDGAVAGFPLRAESVAVFYRRLMEEMAQIGLPVRINKRPNEVRDPVPFDQDEAHASYDPEYANRFWRALVQSDRVFREFRSHFIGKCSPVHFFWGIPDLAVTRFSGRPAPEHPGGIRNLPDRVTREAYSHEMSSCGFIAGGGRVRHAAFYCYAYPEPGGFAATPVRPHEAFYHDELRQFLLSYDVVRQSENPDTMLLDFLQTTYEAAATLGNWNRAALEREA